LSTAHKEIFETWTGSILKDDSDSGASDALKVALKKRGTVDAVHAFAERRGKVKAIPKSLAERATWAVALLKTIWAIVLCVGIFVAFTFGMVFGIWIGLILASRIDGGKTCFARAFYAKVTTELECPWSASLWNRLTVDNLVLFVSGVSNWAQPHLLGHFGNLALNLA
jgi:hypothetical protein